MNRCKFCDREYKYDRSKGCTKEKCNSCHTNRRRFELKEKMLKIKGGACELCGFNKYKTALAFHHLNPNTKVFNLSGAHSRSWKSIEAELAKCILVCQNCHSGIHEGLITL